MSKKKKEKFEMIKNVELFRAGYTNDGREISNERISDIVKDTKLAVADGYTPKAKIGDTHASGKLAGAIQNIRQLGNSIIADLELTSETFDKLNTDKNIYDTRSIELAKGFVLSNGESLNEIIDGLAIGILNPAEHNLSSMFEASLNGRQVESFERLDFGSIEKKEKEAEMPDGKNVITVEQFSGLVSENTKLKAEIEGLKKEVKGFKDNPETFSRDEKKALEKEVAELTKTVETFESDKKIAVIDELIKDGKVKPAEKDNAVEYFERQILGREGDVKLAIEDLNEHFSRNVAPNMEQSVETGTSVKKNSTEYITTSNHSAEGGK